MIAFLDSSVILRKMFGEPDHLAEWDQISAAHASRLFPLEVHRVIERARLTGAIGDAEVADLHTEFRRLLRSIEILGLSEPILLRAAGPMPTMVGTLDAIHLASALELARTLEEDLTLATHDEQLARAARASGLTVIGV
jgi:predicted nucleic acid-binding protein